MRLPVVIHVIGVSQGPRNESWDILLIGLKSREVTKGAKGVRVDDAHAYAHPDAQLLSSPFFDVQISSIQTPGAEYVWIQSPRLWIEQALDLDLMKFEHRVDCIRDVKAGQAGHEKVAAALDIGPAHHRVGELCLNFPSPHLRILVPWPRMPRGEESEQFNGITP